MEVKKMQDIVSTCGEEKIIDRSLLPKRQFVV